MINVNQITSRLANMPDQALQQYAAMHKNDPYTMALALSESNRRKQMRQGAQMQAPQQPKVVDQEIAQMAQPMPEDTGIGQLPAPNIERMAEGGIVAFENGGEVPGYAGGVFTGSSEDYTPAFNAAYNRVRKIEGGYVKNDAGRGPTMYGINWTANQKALKDLGYTADTMRKLTPEDAKQIYKRDYWDAIKGDALAKDNPAFAQIALDTAVNQGQGTARKLIAKADGEPNKLLALRQRAYIDLATPKETDTPAQAERRKEHKSNLGAWTERVSGLKNDLDAGKLRLPTMLPGSEAQAATAPQEDMSFLDKSKKALVGAGTAGLSALAGAAPAVYEAFTPSFAPSTTLPQAVGRTAATANPLAALSLTGGALSTGATNALSNATPEQLDQLSSDVGSDTGLAAAIMNAPNRPTETPPISYGDQMANIAKTIVSAPDRPRKPEPAPEPVVEPVEKGGMPDLNQAFRQFELAQQNKTEDVQVAAPKPEDAGIAKLMPEEPKKNETDWGNLALMFGLNLLAGDSPNALTNVGKAGLNTLAMQQAEAKAKSERETKLSETNYRKAMSRYYDESADAIARGAKEKNNVQMAEQAAVNAAKAWADANKMALLQTPGLFDQKLREFRMEAYKNFGIEPTMTASAPDATGGGFKLLGVRPS